tara:strand:+ start:216 stop:452 length:237 start_codon:yes stop_codon:yes gene_type:complete
MKSSNPPEMVLFPAAISLSQESAYLLNYMANEMSVSLDELISSIAEDSVKELQSKKLVEDIHIPGSVSLDQLQKRLSR